MTNWNPKIGEPRILNYCAHISQLIGALMKINALISMRLRLLAVMLRNKQLSRAETVKCHFDTFKA